MVQVLKNMTITPSENIEQKIEDCWPIRIDMVQVSAFQHPICIKKAIDLKINLKNLENFYVQAKNVYQTIKKAEIMMKKSADSKIKPFFYGHIKSYFLQLNWDFPSYIILSNLAYHLYFIMVVIMSIYLRCCKAQNRQKLRKFCLPCTSLCSKDERVEYQTGEIEDLAESNNGVSQVEEVVPRITSNQRRRPMALTYIS